MTWYYLNLKGFLGAELKGAQEDIHILTAYEKWERERDKSVDMSTQRPSASLSHLAYCTRMPSRGDANL